MSDILIQGMEMPTGDDDVRIIIGSNGSVHRIIGWAISEKTKAKAIEIPPHGDLVEISKVKEAQRIHGQAGHWESHVPVIMGASE